VIGYELVGGVFSCSFLERKEPKELPVGVGIGF
jgi:hypothetical protein